MNDIGLQARQKSFANEFSDFSPPLVARLTFAHGAWRVPDVDMFPRQHTCKRGTNGVNRIGEQSAKRKMNFMDATVTHDCLRHCQRVAAYSAKPAFGLRALHVDNYAH